jgi:lipopolysaccharide export system permease protein
MPVLDRYIIRSIGASVVVVVMALLTLLALFLFINEQGWVGVGRYGNLQALQYVALNLPGQLFQFLPIGVLIGSLLALGGLSRHSELTVMRASGVSIARIALSVFLAGLLAVPIAILARDYLAPPMARQARIHRAIERNADFSLAGRGGAWVRDGNVVLRAAQQSAEGAYGGIAVFELGAGHRLAAVGVAMQATEQADHSWRLQDYRWSAFAPEGVGFGVDAAHRLETNVSPAFLGMIVADPYELSLRELRRTAGYFEANGQDSRRLRFMFWSVVARLAALPFAALLALPLLFGPLRRVETGARASLGLALGLGYFILSRMVESGTIALGLNPLLLAWAPTALLIAAVALLFARLRH